MGGALPVGALVLLVLFMIAIRWVRRPNCQPPVRNGPCRKFTRACVGMSPRFLANFAGNSLRRSAKHDRTGALRRQSAGEPRPCRHSAHQGYQSGRPATRGPTGSALGNRRPARTGAHAVRGLGDAGALYWFLTARTAPDHARTRPASFPASWYLPLADRQYALDIASPDRRRPGARDRGALLLADFSGGRRRGLRLRGPGGLGAAGEACS